MNATPVGQFVTAMLLATAGPVLGGPAHLPTLQQLLEGSDVVAMGKVFSTEKVGRTSVEMPSTKIGANLYGAVLLVDEILKGPSSLTSISFQFVVPDQFIGYRTTAVGEYRIFFLRQGESRYELTSPYYPSVPAVPGTILDSGNVADQIVQVESAVIRSVAVPTSLIREAIYVLRQTESKAPTALRALREALQHDDQSIRLSAAAALLGFGDRSALAVTEAALLRSGSTVSPDLLLGLRVAIADHLPINADTLTPTLHLLSEGDQTTRRSVARALRRISGPMAFPLFKMALNDPDAEVQYNAVIGLAELADQRDRAPSRRAFLAAREAHVSYWKHWLNNR